MRLFHVLAYMYIYFYHPRIFQDTARQVLLVDAWQKWTWVDTTLADLLKYYEVDALEIPVDFIWVPDIILYNRYAVDCILKMLSITSCISKEVSNCLLLLLCTPNIYIYLIIIL